MRQVIVNGDKFDSNSIRMNSSLRYSVSSLNIIVYSEIQYFYEIINDEISIPFIIQENQKVALHRGVKNNCTNLIYSFLHVIMPLLY